jgi:hypothetical protein
MGDASAWIGFVGALLGAVAAAWGAARYSHIHTLRSAWADWTACFYQMIGIWDQLREARERPVDAKPPYYPDYYAHLQALEDKYERASDNLLREQQRLLLLEADEEWIHVLQTASGIAVSEELGGDDLEDLHVYVRDDLTPKLRERLGRIWLQESPPLLKRVDRNAVTRLR